VAKERRRHRVRTGGLHRLRRVASPPAELGRDAVHLGKLTHLNSLPQGQPQRDERTLSMVATMGKRGLWQLLELRRCEAVCPKRITLEFIGRMNRDLIGRSGIATGRR